MTASYELLSCASRSVPRIRVTTTFFVFTRLSPSPTTPQAAARMRLGRQLARYCEMTVARKPGTTPGAFFVAACVFVFRVAVKNKKWRIDGLPNKI